MFAGAGAASMLGPQMRAAVQRRRSAIRRPELHSASGPGIYDLVSPLAGAVIQSPGFAVCTGAARGGGRGAERGRPDNSPSKKK
eukprot:1508733-Alexandrium_andersonii.AAC.1